MPTEMNSSTASRPQRRDQANVSTANGCRDRQKPGAKAAGRLGKRAALLALACTLTACSTLSETGFSFPTRGEQIGGSPRLTAPAKTRTQASFAQGRVTLVAPSGHCIDTTMLRQETEGGFALLPRCNLLNGAQLFGRNRAAVITATIGPARGSETPSTTDLARTAAGAKLLYYDDKGPLPLVRLHWPGHSAMGGSGASDEQWRGAFVVNGHLVVLALYAPEGSDLLGPAGARLLTDMTRRSQKASQRAAPGPEVLSAREETTPEMVPSSAPARLRPKSRPGTEPRQSNADPGGSSDTPAQKLSLGKRISGLFQSNRPARLTTE